MKPRFCYYVSPAQEPPFVPSIVRENEPGHAPLIGRDDLAQPWVWGDTLAEAEAVCAEANRKLGLSQDDVDAIIASSMKARNHG